MYSSITVIDIIDKKEFEFKDRLRIICKSGLVSDKLLRLFATWCVRQVQHLLGDTRAVIALNTVEAFANGAASKTDLSRACYVAYDYSDFVLYLGEGTVEHFAALAIAHAADYSASYAAYYAAFYAVNAASSGMIEKNAAEAAQEAKLREMLLHGVEAGDVVLDGVILTNTPLMSLVGS